MPRGDKTGPNGAGPMTGRGAGYCIGNEQPGFANQVGVSGYGRRGGQGLRRGAGGGRGRGGRGMGRNWAAPGASPEPPYNMNEARFSAPAESSYTENQERAYLKAQAKEAKRRLEEIEARLAEMKREPKDGE